MEAPDFTATPWNSVRPDAHTDPSVVHRRRPGRSKRPRPPLSNVARVTTATRMNTDASHPRAGEAGFVRYHAGLGPAPATDPSRRCSTGGMCQILPPQPGVHLAGFEWVRRHAARRVRKAHRPCLPVFHTAKAVDQPAMTCVFVGF